MKNIITIIAMTLIMSCSTPEKIEPCKCTMTTYVTGEPNNFTNKYVVGEREVFCQDEVYRELIGADVYFDVVCSK